MLRSLEALEQDASFIEEAAERQIRRINGKKSLPADFIRDLHQALLVALGAEEPATLIFGLQVRSWLQKY